MPNQIPARTEVQTENTWDLNGLFPDDEAWETGLTEFDQMIPTIGTLKGTLAESAEKLVAALGFYRDYGMLEERLGNYAFLRQAEDEGDSEARARTGRFMMTATKGEGEWSWFVPEIQRVPSDSLEQWMQTPAFDDLRVFLTKLIRYKPHVLSEGEERLLALQIEANQTASETFSVLTNVDFDFGEVETPEGPRPLSQSTYSSLMHHADRPTREKAYKQFYKVFEGHKTTLAELYSGSCKLDKYKAQVRNHPSARAASLFPDDVPESVYDNLVGTINDNLPTLHKYYGVRAKAMGLEKLKHYDVYVPLVKPAESIISYDEAVTMIASALAPLGDEYVSVLKGGLLGRWVDRYENKGKSSGAFSAGGFAGDPYILMNYKDDVIRDVFTLAHEGGHSMHSYYSAKSNPFLQYNYTIFEAEVASTFNESLLFKYLIEQDNSDEMKAYLVNTRVDEILGTLFRQTMFAEFEHLMHQALESGTPLTIDFLREQYGELLAKYFGPIMELEENSNMEGLRIPHFYRAFYVYKYSTGISASIALSKRVLNGGDSEREDYFKFLRSGGSRFPLESLKVAGVDMSKPDAVQAACDEFAELVTQLEQLLGQ